MPYDPSLDHVAIVTTARTAPGLPPLGQPLTPQQGAEVCRAAVCELRRRGEDASLLAGKSEGQNHGDIDDQRVAVDIICYPSTGVHWDCLVDDGKQVGWQDKGPWTAPLVAYVPTGCGSVDPPDPPVTLATLDAKIDALDRLVRHDHGWALSVLMADVAAIKVKLGI